MYCNRCGAEAPDKASFCSTCGVDLNATTPMAAMNIFERESDLDVVRSALRSEYDVKEEIGRGGMATVYRAEEKGLGRQVAIKVLPFSHTHDASLVERFQLEARTAAKLEHPNIIPIYRVGRQGDVIFFTMRYLHGPSLSELIGEMGAMAPDHIRRILIQSAGALGHAHKTGVVHRDIKPDNIMFKDNGEAVVCDFGIAKAASGTGLTGTGMAIGTPYYMSPEQVRAKPLSGSSDIYSLGVVAFQCMTTHVPFDGDDSFAIGYKHVMEDPPTPELKSDEHRALWSVISRMMEKHPGDRFQSAEELIAALHGDRSALPITARQPAAAAVTDELPATQRAPALPGPGPARRRASVMTPTTPVPRISIEAPAPKRRPLRIAAMLGGIFFLLAGGGLGGGYVYLENGGQIPQTLRRYEPALQARAPWLANTIPLQRWLTNGQPQIVVDSAIADTAAAPVPPDDSLPPADSLGGTDSLASAPDSLPADTVAADTATADTATVPPEPITGTLVIRNAGPRASLWINDQRVRGLTHELPVGEYAIRIVAPLHEPYNARVSVTAGKTLTHRANLRVRSQCQEFGESYNRDGACFDTRARLDPRTSTLVPLTPSVPRHPTTPVELLIMVLPDGTAGTIVVRSPSDVPEFALAAVGYARTLSYSPALKNGQPVEAWTTLALFAKP